MFRYKRGVKLDYKKQGYIYFTSLRYKELPEEKQKAIRELCDRCGGEYAAALFEFVTTDVTATALEMKYHLGRSTLYRAVRKYYASFPDKL